MKSFIFLLLTSFCGTQFVSCQSGGSIPVDQLTSIVQSDSTLLLDVRTNQEFAEGHVDGSINIPVGELADRTSELGEWKHIVVYCRAGRRAATAKQILEDKGFNNVVNGQTWVVVKELKGKKDDSCCNSPEDMKQ